MSFEKELQLGKDSVWVLAARLGAQGSLALFTLLIARRLGSASFGEYAFISSAVFIGNIITTFGTDMLLIREIAADRDFSKFFPSLLLQIILSIFLIALVWLLPPLPGQSEDGWLALKIFTLSLIPFSFFNVFSAVLRGLQRMDQYGVLNFVTQFIQLGAAYFFISSRSSVVSLAWLLVVVQLIGAGIAAWYCRDQFSHFRLPKQFSLNELRPVLPLALLSVLGIIYQSLPILLVTFLLGAAATGYFSAAKRVVEFAKTVHLAIFTVLYPAMAGSQPGLKNSRLIWAVLLIGALAAVVGISTLAAPLTLILYGEAYGSSIPLLRLLPWLLMPFTIGTFLSLIFVADNQERPVVLALFTGLFLMVLLNFIWTPAYGIIGAGWAWLIAESVQSVILLIKFRSTHGVPYEFPQPAG